MNFIIGCCCSWVAAKKGKEKEECKKHDIEIK
jgi:hypothetical protein